MSGLLLSPARTALLELVSLRERVAALETRIADLEKREKPPAERIDGSRARASRKASL